MTKNDALLAFLLLAAPCLRAAAQPADAALATEPADIIVPLNVRDPSALVMGPGAGGAPNTISIEAPVRAPAAGALKVAKSSFDKAGPARGRRSVGVPVPEDQLLTVKPGDHVDLLAVFDRVNGAGVKEKTAATILQNVKVLGVTTSADLRATGVLTLELNPVEAQYALLGVRQADLGVAVRSPGDEEMYPMEMSAFFRLFR
ncbi:MAG: hypothetical protein HYV14_11300 [Elusimicrobia bacterium]|nr:hypothetical protein [Elusimicrobiota bacterium]